MKVNIKPDWIWRLGVRLSLCKGEQPDRTYKSVIWIAGVVLVAIAAVRLVTTVMRLAM